MKFLMKIIIQMHADWPWVLHLNLKKTAPVYNIDITEFHLSLNSNKINGIGNSILRATTNSVRPVGP